MILMRYIDKRLVFNEKDSEIQGTLSTFLEISKTWKRGGEDGKRVRERLIGRIKCYILTMTITTIPFHKQI